MSGNTNKQQENREEIVALRKILSRVDQGIPIPDRLSGQAMLSLLNELPEAEPTVTTKQKIFAYGSKFFTLRAAVGYAAAFIFIVGIAYFSRGPAPNMVENAIPVAPPASQEADIAPKQDDMNRIMDVEPNVVDDVEELEVLPFTDTSTETETPEIVVEDGPHGGGSTTVQIGVWEDYGFVWRANDTSDPDKAQYPVTLDVVNNTDQTLVEQIDIPDMTSIITCLTNSDTLIIIGENANNVVTRAYSGLDIMQLQWLNTAPQPGSYVDSRVHNDVLYAISLSPEHTLDYVKSVPLDYSDQQGYLYVTALDLKSGTINQMAFSGAENADISLHGGYMYITYTGQTPEKESSEPFVAEIILDNMDITLNQIS